ncbi:HR1-domain-containing protein, partial [Xylona heveae TC161]
MDDERLIGDVNRKIEREKALINGANAVRNSSNNPAVKQRAESQIHEGHKNITYLEGQLKVLQSRRLGHSMDNLSIASGADGSQYAGPSGGSPQRGTRGGVPPGQQGSSIDGRGSFGTDAADYGDPGPGGYSSQLGTGHMMPPRPPFTPPAPTVGIPKARPNYSKLDLIKYDTPYLGPRIQLMLSQLEFKLSVEKQYKEGIEKMVRLYQIEGDKKSKADAEGRRIESAQKIQLLKQALKRYEDLHVDIESATDAPDDDSINTPNLRKPLTGHLSLRIHAIRDVDHAATGRFARGPETFVMIKVEDAFKGRTKSTRTGRWPDEVHELDIDKANEIELTVYDKAGDHPLPIGMLWIRISDIAEEMRRKKIETEFNNSGWVSADKMQDGGSASRQDSQYGQTPGQPHAPPASAGINPAPTFNVSAGPGQAPISIDAWFALEPVGQIHLSMSFVKQLNNRRPLDFGLNRKGAIRQRKEEVHETFGHRFVTQQFYNIMRCALCGDFLKYAAGMQCADCKYTCHKKCYSKVVVKCISKSNAEADPEEEKLNHRIPHRFEGFSNMGANWCCHCGYILPLGSKKNCRKCTECGLTCHTQCAHLVPDFCGMSMEVANQILREIRTTKKRQTTSSMNSVSSMSSRTLRPGGRPTPPPPSQPSYAPPPGQEQP